MLSGVVLSAENRQPIPGVAVAIPGVATAITDDNGKFMLQNVEKGAVVQLRVPGMAAKEVVVGSKREVTILMNDESLKSIYNQTYSPYGNKDWKATTGAVTVIANKENYKKGATSPETLIQDAGLGVNTLIKSGMPGAGGNMYVWGFSSINATSQPMVLIDGVPYENLAITPSLISGNNITPLGGFEVKDIESITILKNATSLYGSKGGNGVILIETAKAREHATKIDFYAYTGLNSLPVDAYPVMNGWEYRAYLSDLLGRSGMYSSWLELQKEPFMDQTKPTGTPNASIHGGVDGNLDYYRYNQETDWQKEVFQSSLSQNYYMSIKGGDDVALYALSLGYLSHEGIIKSTDFTRYSTQFNSQFNIARWFKMYSNVNVSYNDRSLVYDGMVPKHSPVNASLIKAPFMAPQVYSVWGAHTPIFEPADVFGMSNPSVLVSDASLVYNKTYRFFGNIGAAADLGKGFDVNVTFGVTFDKLRENIFLPQKGLSHEMLPAGEVTNQMKALVSRYLQFYTDFHVKYKRVFDKKHNLTAMLGMRYQTNNAEGDWISAYNSSSDDMRTIGSGKLDLASAAGLLEDWKWMSFYLNGEYAYNKRYFLSLNMAMDGSSRFGADAGNLRIGGSAFGFFPSVTGAWLVSSEDFLSDIDMLNVLRLRLGYSAAGNDNIENYAARTSYVSQNFFGFYGLTRSNYANPSLKWETNTKLNAGIDVAMFNDRLNVSFDVFQSKTTDLLMLEEDYGLPYYINSGAMQNRGFDLGVWGRVISNVNFKWDVGVNVSVYRNKVISLSQNDKITKVANGNVITREGSPVGLFYGHKTDGVYATSDIATAEGLHIPLPATDSLISFKGGDMRFVSINGDNIIDENDMTVIGDPNPDFIGSITSKLQWKRLSFDMVWTYSYGNDVYNALRASLEAMSGYENQTRNVMNRWSKEGHVTNTPRAQWGDPMGNARFSDRWIEDGSYLRLKTLSVSYDVPINIRIIRAIQVYATANNLLTFTNYLGYDPEFSAQQSPLYYGVDMGLTPQPRTVLLGVRLGF
jgi:TonB-linked SusC/RagA family outer membrane protein